MTKLCRAQTWARFPLARVVRLILVGLLVAGSGGAQYTITTVAGDESLHYSGDNVPATKTAVNPSALDTFGNLYLADGAGGRSGGTIRKINTAGIITTVMAAA